MEEDIIRKLEVELRSGTTTEVQVVYLMAAIRKVLEQRQAKRNYPYLNFYCDWTLHSKLEGRAAQEMLKQFDLANVHLKEGAELHDLPPELRREIDRISKMRSFKDELYKFLRINGLPSLDENRSDGWVHFLHLYAKVVEDCPLVISPKAWKSASVASVTLHVEMANEPVEGETLFKVTWTVMNTNGLSGEIFVINSFSV
ncbi:MAG: hypothetical protein WAL95_07190 [Candidatus Acidiferrales bacterium]